MLPPGRGGVRLGQAQARAALDARRQRAGRLGHGDRRLGSPADAGGGPHRADAPTATREVSCATSDIGTGTYTIMAQVAADMLGLPIENITIKLGDSTLPQAPVEGGSWMAASVSHAIAATAEEVREELLRAGARRCRTRRWRTPTLEDVALADGKIVSKRDASARSRLRTRCGTAPSTGSRRRRPTVSQDGKTHARNTHSAVFAEVKVDEQLGVIRVTRVVNAVAAGRILNTKTAHSQIMGSVVWGIGMALHEETVFDHRFGRIMNANIAEYHVPVNADVHDIKVIFVDEPDDIVNPLGIKGARRDRHRRRRRGDRQRRLPRHRQARARPADHAGQAAALARSARRLASPRGRQRARRDHQRQQQQRRCQQERRARQLQRRLRADEIGECQREQERPDHLRHALHAGVGALQLALLVWRDQLRHQRLDRRARHAPQRHHGNAEPDSGPVGASPKIRKPTAPQPSPSISARRSPKRRTIGPIAAPCTTIAQTPTMASVRPTVVVSQP